jgi:hypothetical protein
MKKLFFLAVLFTGCISSPQTDTQVTENEFIPATTWNDYSYGYQFFTEIPGTDYIMIPLGGNGDRKESGRYSLKSGNSSSLIRNYVFCNLKTGVQKLLTDSCHFRFESAIPVSFRKDSSEPAILYYVRNEDFNNDGNIDFSDNRQLFVSDNDGSNLRPVCPAGTNVTGYWFPKDSAIVILSCIKDINNDKMFTDADPAELWSFRWPFNNNLKPFFNKDILNELNEMNQNCKEEGKK